MPLADFAVIPQRLVAVDDEDELAIAIQVRGAESCHRGRRASMAARHASGGWRSAASTADTVASNIKETMTDTEIMRRGSRAARMNPAALVPLTYRLEQP